MKHAAIFAAALAACSSHVETKLDPPSTVPVWIDYRLSPDSLAGVLDGIAEWNAALNGNVRYEVASVDFDFWPEVLDRVNRTGLGLVILHQPRCLEDGGWADQIPGNYVHLCPAERVWIRPILLHEIGHTLGLTHSANPNDLMHGRVSHMACVDDDAIRQLRDLHPNWTPMAPCR